MPLSKVKCVLGVPGAAHRRLITDVLRGELGVDGFVVSDAGSVIDLTTHGFARDDRDAAARALGAGLDMEMSLGARMKADSVPADADIDPAAIASALATMPVPGQRRRVRDATG